MKKTAVLAVCALTAFAFAGCAQQGNKLENVDTTKVLAPSEVNMSEFKNNLEGLEGYFVKLNYIPANTTPTEMLSSIIGAVDGDRYIFSVNNSAVTVELYEYEPDKLDKEATRVLGEVKETGSFHVFGDKSIDGDATYQATLSDNEKYLMIYNDNSNSDTNQAHKKVVIDTFKAFYSTTPTETSTTQESKTEESKTEESKTEESKSESKTEESKAA